MTCYQHVFEPLDARVDDQSRVEAQHTSPSESSCGGECYLSNEVADQDGREVGRYDVPNMSRETIASIGDGHRYG